MTQFQHTLKQLLTGEKTETSRIALPEPDGTGTFACEMLCFPFGIKAVERWNVSTQNWRTVWQVGKDYAIEPHRGVRSVGRYRAEAIWRQDVRTLTQEQVEAEGFIERWDFLLTWAMMHDKVIYPVMFDTFEDCNDPGRHHPDFAPSIRGITRYTVDRPAERYQAWRMTIKVLWSTIDWEAPAVKALQIEPKTVN